MDKDNEFWSVASQWIVNVPYTFEWSEKQVFVFLTSDYSAEKECEKIDSIFDKCEDKTALGKNLLNSLGVKT